MLAQRSVALILLIAAAVVAVRPMVLEWAYVGPPFALVIAGGILAFVRRRWAMSVAAMLTIGGGLVLGVAALVALAGAVLKLMGSSSEAVESAVGTGAGLGLVAVIAVGAGFLSLHLARDAPRP